MSDKNKALFLDRDGTVIIHVPYVFKPEEIEILPGVKAVLHRATKAGYKLFLFTNQSGIGRGMFTMEDAIACNERMIELLELPDPAFVEICIAPEHPDLPAIYRKPSPRFIHEMIIKHNLDPEATWMIGDKPSDVEAGIAANVRTALVYNAEDEVPAETAKFADLPEFLERLLSNLI